MEFQFNTVSERDMDLLFLEEFAINKGFLNLFLQKIKGEPGLSEYQIISEEISHVEPALGESDLTVILEKDSHKIALLIEDKISAAPQPQQYKRYEQRGKKAIQERQYDDFFIFLIAPKEYLDGSTSASQYPHHVTYEECIDLLTQQTDVRSQLKVQQLTQAIAQASKPYTKTVDPKSTDFWDKYVQYLHTHYPDIALRSKVSTKSKDGDWPTYWTVLDMKQVYIHHKMNMKGVNYSYIDLTFNGLAAHREQLKALLKDMLGENYGPLFGMHKAGKSAVLRLVAPKNLDWQKPFEDQIDTVELHLQLVTKLCKAAKQIDRTRLQEFYLETSRKD